MPQLDPHPAMAAADNVLHLRSASSSERREHLSFACIVRSLHPPSTNLQFPQIHDPPAALAADAEDPDCRFLSGALVNTVLRFAFGSLLPFVFMVNTRVFVWMNE